MPDIELRRAHGLGLEAARAAADQMAEHLGRKFDLRGRWSGNVLHFERPGVQGELAVDAKSLQLSVTLGFLLKAMKASIERAVQEELDKLFVAKRHREAPRRAAARPGKGSARRKKAG